MKRIFIILLLIISLTACDLFKEENKDYNEIILKDKAYGTTKFTYSKDKEYVIEKDKSNNPITLNISSEEENFILSITHINTSNKSYTDSKKNRIKSSVFKEYKWNKFNGYTYNGDKTKINFLILLRESEEHAIGLHGILQTTNDKNAIELFRSEEFQNLLNTITFNEKEE